jgi:hypothetical protein
MNSYCNKLNNSREHFCAEFLGELSQKENAALRSESDGFILRTFHRFREFFVANLRSQPGTASVSNIFKYIGS